jgi:hypothetical protein
MTTANHLINALAAQDKDEANSAFDAVVQDKISDFLEVRKVELASTIMDDLQEGQGMDAQRRWTRHVSAIGKGYEGGLGHKVSVHRQELKGAARKYFKNMGGVEGGVGAEYVDRGAKFVKDARTAVKNKKLQGEETELEEAFVHVNGATSTTDRKAVKHGGVVHTDTQLGSIYKFKNKKAASRFKSGQADAHHWTKADVDGLKEDTLEEGGPTRKHFQQTADLLKNIPDEAKRKELAQHHAGLYKAQNPRFDRATFMAASGVNEALDPGAAPSNAALNRNVMANIRRAVQSLGVKGVNPAMAAAGHRDFGKLVAKNPKAPGYALMRKLAPGKAAAVNSLTQAGVPLGASLEASPQEFNQVVQRIKRFK